ncbi:hypothetical protein [uncultured Tateyamaria sp.]|uniref:hypothetical protein n=1 Tax=uncultured Tateyamaria sp. TaxID=455651 RepID=UPI0026135395|nr:hypothetical protein [uncultured Tateyamaria sp.]
MKYATLMTALTLAFTAATTAQADLSPADVDTLNQRVKYPVLASDGSVLGTMDGISFQGDRARIFVRSRGGNIFRRTGGKDIVVTTRTDLLTLRGNQLVMDADTQRVRVKANKSFTDDSSPITILLLN